MQRSEHAGLPHQLRRRALAVGVKRHRARRFASALLATLLGLTFLPLLHAGASEAPDSQEEPTAADEIQVADGRYEIPAGASNRGMWMWPQGRRGYFLKAWTNAILGDFGDELIAVDLDTHEVVDRAELEPAAWYTLDTDNFSWGHGRNHTIAVDDEGGRLVVPYGIRYSGNNIVDPGTSLGNAAGNVASHGRMCANQPGLAGDPPGILKDTRCVGGVHVVDAATLETVTSIALSSPLVVDDPGNGGFMPMLRAVAFSHAMEGESSGGKVHLVVEDYQHHVYVGNQAGLGTRDETKQFNIWYAIQLDIDSGTQDWAVRLDACRGSRDHGMLKPEHYPYPSAVLRSAHDGDVYVGCNVGSARSTVVIRVPLDDQGHPYPGVTPGDPDEVAGRLADDGPDAQVGPDDVASRGERQQHWVGPNAGMEFYADAASGRMVIRANPLRGEMLWVFDAAERAFIGGIGIGNGYELWDIQAGFDRLSGRVYVLAAAVDGSYSGGIRGDANEPGGLYVADIRGTPLSQAAHYPHLVPDDPGTTRWEGLVVDSGGPGGPRNVYRILPVGGNPGPARNASRAYQIIQDKQVIGAPARPAGFDGLTLDLDEVEGVTGRSFDGAARGYGARVLLAGGVHAAARQSPVDPLTGFDAFWTHPYLGQTSHSDSHGPNPLPECQHPNREVVLAFSGSNGPAVVDGGGARGGVQPLVTDHTTGQDAQTPVSRCGDQDWDGMWESALFSAPPFAEPGAPSWPFTAESQSSCVSGAEDETQDKWSDPYLGRFSGEVSCEGDAAGGHTQAGGLGLDGLSVSEAISRFHVYLDAERGLVSQVESIARGVKIGPLISIDTIRGSAESWANGRANPDDGDALAGGPAADTNCDRSRTAGTCFQRHFFGVTVQDPRGGVAYRCGPCGDEGALVDALNSALGTNGSARLRDADPRYARGAENGYLAAVVKPDSERFADVILNNDLLETVVPSLEIVRYGTTSPPPTVMVVNFEAYTPRQGRQIIQLAGVEVSSTYSIQCLLVYDEVANTCAEAVEVPGSIQVSLSDPDGQPLAGGAFEVREDVDADGVLGLKDTLLPDGACVTAEDGVGTCTFEGLQPGSYLVNQVAAPPGYAKSAEPWVSEVASGEQRIVAFTNVSNVSTIDMKVTDDAGAPVSGATFAAYPDPDSDGKVAPEAEPAATCTTDAQGVCSMQVPAGSYVLVQTGAPGGLEGIEPVAFTFASGGQVAAVTVVNYPPSQPAAPEGSASPEVAYSPPVASAPPMETVADYRPPVSEPQPQVSLPEQMGGTVVRVIRAPGDALRLLAREPAQAMALMASLALFALAVMAVRQRSMVSRLALAPVGGLPPAPPSGGSAGPGGGRPRPSPTPKKPSGGPGAGPRGGSGGRPSRGGPARHRRPAGGSAGPKASSASTTQTATLLDDRLVAGGAPAAVEHVSARVVVATALPGLSAVVTRRLADSESCEVLAAVDSIEALRAAVAEQRPDVLVVDLGLVSGGAADVCDLLPQFHPLARTVGLIPPNRSAEALAVRGYGCGLGGLLVADEDLTNGQLAYAVRCVAAGKIFFGPTVQALLLAQPRPASSGDQQANRLSRRELEVARLAAAGVPRGEIAKRLYVTPSTVKTQLRAIRAKLGVTDPRDPVQLRQRLDEFGLLEQGGDPDDR